MFIYIIRIDICPNSLHPCPHFLKPDETPIHHPSPRLPSPPSLEAQTRSPDPFLLLSSPLLDSPHFPDSAPNFFSLILILHLGWANLFISSATFPGHRPSLLCPLRHCQCQTGDLPQTSALVQLSFSDIGFLGNSHSAALYSLLTSSALFFFSFFCLAIPFPTTSILLLADFLTPLLFVPTLETQVTRECVQR